MGSPVPLALRSATSSRVLGPILLGALLLVAFQGCGDDGPSKPPPDDLARVRVEVRYTANGHPLALETGRYLAASGDSFYVSRVRHYLSDFRLEATGATFVDSTRHYVDLEQPGTLTFELTHVSRVQFQTLRFLIGLDDATNFLGGIVEPTLDDLDMEWPIPLGGGYHNIQIEGYFWRDGGERHAFNVHLGRAPAWLDEPTPYLNHSVEVSMNAPVLTEVDGVRGMILEMEIDQWFRTPQVYDFATWGNFIMDKHEPQQILRENGADAFQVSVQ